MRGKETEDAKECLRDILHVSPLLASPRLFNVFPAVQKVKGSELDCLRVCFRPCPGVISLSLLMTSMSPDGRQWRYPSVSKWGGDSGGFRTEAWGLDKLCFMRNVEFCQGIWGTEDGRGGGLNSTASLLWLKKGVVWNGCLPHSWLCVGGRSWTHPPCREHGLMRGK